MISCTSPRLAYPRSFSVDGNGLREIIDGLLIILEEIEDNAAVVVCLVVVGVLLDGEVEKINGLPGMPRVDELVRCL